MASLQQSSSSRMHETHIDRLALGRALHLQSRDGRPKSVSDEEVDAISDWSESDRECCSISDFETASISNKENHASHPASSSVNASTLPSISTSNVSQRPAISRATEIDKQRRRFVKKLSQNQLPSQTALLPARRIQSKPAVSPQPSVRIATGSSSSYHHQSVSLSPTRLHIRRETTSTTLSSTTPATKDAALSSTSSARSLSKSPCDDPRTMVSPNLSQSSVPRVYEIKKVFVDDSTYGRLIDVSSTKPASSRGRQKWGTIMHPPFPLGYQHVTPEQVTQAVERLTSPVRRRDRHAMIQNPSKRYLSVEETNALVTDALHTAGRRHVSSLVADQSIEQSENRSIARSVLVERETIAISHGVPYELERRRHLGVEPRCHVTVRVACSFVTIKFLHSTFFQRHGDDLSTQT